MIKINCELPLQTLLEQNMKLNEYDFVLFHLYQSHPAYREYYRTLRKEHPERVMIFDNSAYEYFIKGEKLDVVAFRRAIEELNPTFYILPDVLMDKAKTLDGVNNFINEGLPEVDSEPLAIIQGNTKREMIDCLEMYKTFGISNIGIPFHNSFYCKWAGIDWPSMFRMWNPKALFEKYPFLNVFKEFCKVYDTIPSLEMGELIPKDIQYAVGRVHFINDIRKKLEDFDYVHILGSHCPFEINFYKDFNSMDTGYPVKLALAGKLLGTEEEKPNTIIDDFFEKHIDPVTTDQIVRNINIFKSYRG